MQIIEVYKYRIRQNGSTILCFLSADLLNDQEIKDLLDSYNIKNRNNLEFRAKVHPMIIR